MPYIISDGRIFRSSNSLLSSMAFRRYITSCMQFANERNIQKNTFIFIYIYTYKIGCKFVVVCLRNFFFVCAITMFFHEPVYLVMERNNSSIDSDQLPTTRSRFSGQVINIVFTRNNVIQFFVLVVVLSVAGAGAAVDFIF